MSLLSSSFQNVPSALHLISVFISIITLICYLIGIAKWLFRGKKIPSACPTYIPGTVFSHHWVPFDYLEKQFY